MSVATSTAIGLAVTAGATAAGQIVSASKQSNAAKAAAQTQSTAATTSAKTQSDAAVKTAQIQADAANQAAQIQAGSAQQALDFSRAQSQVSLDQYNQQQQRLQPYRNLGNFALGLPNDAAPPPIQLPSFSSQSSGGSSAAPSGALPQIDPSKPIGPQAAAYITSMGGTPNSTSADYWQSKWPELVARGQQIGDPLYAQKRLAEADELGGGTGTAAPQPNIGPKAPVTLSYTPPVAPVAAPATPLTPALKPPIFSYRPLGSIGEGY